MLQSKGEGPDKEKPPCKKAKLLRLERKKQKLARKGLSIDSQQPLHKQNSSQKTLEDFLYPDMSPNPGHRLQVRAVF